MSDQNSLEEPTNTIDNIDEYTHYHRTCLNCGRNWWGLHCPHDGYQNNCPNCNIRPHTVIEPKDGCDCEFLVPVAAINKTIMEDMLAIIGEDEPQHADYSTQVLLAVAERNNLRASLRQAVIKKYGRAE